MSCDHPRQIQAPDIDLDGPVWLCEDCWAICGPVNDEPSELVQPIPAPREAER